MTTYWANFARSGDPNGAGLPEVARVYDGGERQPRHAPRREHSRRGRSAAAPLRGARSFRREARGFHSWENWVSCSTTIAAGRHDASPSILDFFERLRWRSRRLATCGSDARTAVCRPTQTRRPRCRASYSSTATLRTWSCHTDFNCLSVLQFAVDCTEGQARHRMRSRRLRRRAGGACRALKLGLADNWLRHVQDVHLRYQMQVDNAGDVEARLNRLCELNAIRAGGAYLRVHRRPGRVGPWPGAHDPRTGLCARYGRLRRPGLRRQERSRSCRSALVTALNGKPRIREA